MGAADVDNFVQFFQEFIHICLSNTWPDDTTQPETFRITFLRALHIEESIRKLKSETNCFNDFLSLLSYDQQCTDVFLQNCLSDPPKYVLKTIINSNADDNQVLIGFKMFQEVFTEERLTSSLSDLLVEAASKETLLRNMTELPSHTLLQFQSQLYLLKLIACDSNEQVVNMVKDCDQQTMNILVTCLLKDNQKFYNSVEKIKSAFIEVMSYKDESVKKFWKLFFNVDTTSFIQICLRYENICRNIFETLKDSCIEVISNSHAESLNFTSQQLVSAIKKIYKNDTLKLDFSEYMKENDFDVAYLLSVIS